MVMTKRIERMLRELHAGPPLALLEALFAVPAAPPEAADRKEKGPVAMTGPFESGAPGRI